MNGFSLSTSIKNGCYLLFEALIYENMFLASVCNQVIKISMAPNDTAAPQVGW